jgi:hypothetical protein
MSSNQPVNMEDLLAPLRARYVQELEERQKLLESYLEAIRRNEFTDVLREETRKLAHKLAGTGTTYGFPVISEKGKILDDKLRDNLQTEASVIAIDLESLLAACKTARGAPS